MMCEVCKCPLYPNEYTSRVCRWCAKTPSSAADIARIPAPIDNSTKRKGQPLASGVLAYFPDALTVVAEVSKAGNEKHHPGSPLHWDKGKSADEEDALLRHLRDHLAGETLDPEDGQLNLGKVAWRALAALQRYLDAQKPAK